MIYEIVIDRHGQETRFEVTKRESAIRAFANWTRDPDTFSATIYSISDDGEITQLRHFERDDS
ncbi:MAG: hypothetical protein J2P48_17600 [Alphaproteobacteria bacterium]|nr:hypothetical protein [Alphaproteobacteria bacterium]